MRAPHLSHVPVCVCSCRQVSQLQALHEQQLRDGGSAPSGAAANSRTPLCFGYLNVGRCEHGDGCRYRHVAADHPDAVADRMRRGEFHKIPTYANPMLDQNPNVAFGETRICFSFLNRRECTKEGCAFRHLLPGHPDAIADRARTGRGLPSQADAGTAHMVQMAQQMQIAQHMALTMQAASMQIAPHGQMPQAPGAGGSALPMPQPQLPPMPQAQAPIHMLGMVGANPAANAEHKFGHDQMVMGGPPGQGAQLQQQQQQQQQQPAGIPQQPQQMAPRILNGHNGGLGGMPMAHMESASWISQPSSNDGVSLAWAQQQQTQQQQQQQYQQQQKQQQQQFASGVHQVPWAGVWGVQPAMQSAVPSDARICFPFLNSGRCDRGALCKFRHLSQDHPDAIADRIRTGHRHKIPMQAQLGSDATVAAAHTSSGMQMAQVSGGVPAPEGATSW
jgi:hypothetical protein